MRNKKETGESEHLGGCQVVLLLLSDTGVSSNEGHGYKAYPFRGLGRPMCRSFDDLCEIISHYKYHLSSGAESGINDREPGTSTFKKCTSRCGKGTTTFNSLNLLSI